MGKGRDKEQEPEYEVINDRTQFLPDTEGPRLKRRRESQLKRARVVSTSLEEGGKYKWTK